MKRDRPRVNVQLHSLVKVVYGAVCTAVVSEGRLLLVLLAFRPEYILLLQQQRLRLVCRDTPDL